MSQATEMVARIIKTEDESGLAECISLYKQCPVEKRIYLNRIISEYLHAVR